MQLILLLLIIILSLILYRLLSSRKVTYPYIRTTRIATAGDLAGSRTTEPETGLITIDNDTLIVEGEEYSLKPRKGGAPQACLNIEENKLISVSVLMENGEKLFFIDPQHNSLNGISLGQLNDSSAAFMVSI